MYTRPPAHCVLCICIINAVLPPTHRVLDSYKTTLMTYIIVAYDIYSPTTVWVLCGYIAVGDALFHNRACLYSIQ